MTLTEQDYILLEDYLDNTLPDEAKTTLETRIRSDREFRQSAYEYLTTLKALRAKRNAVLSEKLQAIESAHPSSAIVVPMRRWWLLLGGVGAAAMLVYFIFFPLFNEKNHLSPLVAENFEPYPALGIKRGNEEENMKEKALKSYAIGEYSTSIPLFQKAFALEKDSSLLMYKGIAALASGDVALAIETLKPISESKNENGEIAAWYLALAYLEQKEKTNAREIFIKIIQNQGTYQYKASVILQKLN